MTESLPPLKSLISHRPLGRVLRPADIAGEFLLIRAAWEATGKPAPTATDFAFVARGSGSHLLKLISPRASSGQSVLRFSREGANRRPALAPSIDAKKAPVGKIVFRPFEIEGHPPRHLVDHILNPDEVSTLVLDGFAAAFGQDALNALRDGLVTPLAVTSLPAAEFPIIFLPRPGGGDIEDIQATPVAPVEAYLRMEEVTAPYFQKREEGRSDPPRGRWHRQEVSAKPQNISAAIGQRRTRFLARMPRVLGHWEAALHRYARGGGFPRWQDDGVAPAVLEYVARLDRAEDYSNQDIRRGLDHRADSLIRAARAFIAEVVQHVGEDASRAEPPTIATLILNRAWPNDDARAAARRALTGAHFNDRLAVGKG